MSIGMSPSGKARDFDSRIRGFESRHPCYMFAGLAEVVDAGDLKSPGNNLVPVRVRYPALGMMDRCTFTCRSLDAVKVRAWYPAGTGR